MRSTLKLPVFIILAGGIPFSVQAADDAEITQLREQMKVLQQRYEAQGRALQTLAAQVQQMTAAMSTQTPPAKQAGKRKKGELTAQIPQPTSIQQQAQAVAPSQPAPTPAPASKQLESHTPASQQSLASSPGSASGAENKPIIKKAELSEAQQAVLRQANVLFNRRLTLEAGFSWFYSSRANLNLSGFLALDAIFLGRLGLNQVRSDTLRLDLTARYSFMDRMQVDFNVPFLYRTTNYQSGGVGGASTRLSAVDVSMDPTLADINGGIYYQLFKESTNWPDTVINLRLKAPTGTRPYGIRTVTPDPNNNNLYTPEKLSSGNGVWTPSVGISLVKTFDPAVIFANFSYYYNLDQDFPDITGTGVPGTVRLGNSYQIGLGTSVAINERMSLTFGFTDLITSVSKIRPKGQGWQTIVGSQANSAVLNLGLTFAVTNSASLITNVGVGLTPDAPDVQFTVRLPYTF